MCQRILRLRRGRAAPLAHGVRRRGSEAELLALVGASAVGTLTAMLLLA